MAYDHEFQSHEFSSTMKPHILFIFCFTISLYIFMDEAPTVATEALCFESGIFPPF